MHDTLEGIGMGDQDSEATSFVGAAAAWYALLIAPGLERRACIWLRRRQQEPYWPRYKGPVKLNRHRSIESWRSVIPGYLFLPVCAEPPNLRMMEEERWYRGVLRSASRDLIQIPEFGKEGMERIRQIAEALNASPIAAADGVPFKVGQQIRLSRLEIPGIVIRIDKKRKICIEAKLFGRVVRINVPASEIETI